MNKGGTYFKDIEFPEFNEMLSVWIKLGPDKSKFVVGYIDDMTQCMGSNGWVWTRNGIKYLVKYI